MHFMVYLQVYEYPRNSTTIMSFSILMMVTNNMEEKLSPKTGIQQTKLRVHDKEIINSVEAVSSYKAYFF